MWSEPAPTSESAVDPAVVKFRQDFEMLSKKHGSIVEKTVRRCGPKVVAKAAAVRTHRDGKVGGADREDLIDIACLFDAARLDELLQEDDYEDMKTAFAKQATSLLETDAQSTSESRTHGDQQSLASTGTNGQSMAVKAWMERYGKDQITAQSADVTMLSIVTDFMETLERMTCCQRPSIRRERRRKRSRSEVIYISWSRLAFVVVPLFSIGMFRCVCRVRCFQHVLRV